MSLATSRPALSPLMIPLDTNSPRCSPREGSSPREHSPAESDILRTPFFDQPLQGFAGETPTTESPHDEHFSRDVEQTTNRSASEGFPRPTNMFNSPPSVWQPGKNSSSLLFSTPNSVFDIKLKDALNTPLSSATSSPFSRDSPLPSSSSSSAQLPSACSSKLKHLSPPALHFSTEASTYSSQFPAGHRLNSNFAQTYQLEDELGCGGYGFVMTAYNRVKGSEVAVKFIIKDKVPEHAWMEDETLGRLPTEVVLLSFINHENIVKCLDLFEDHLYFYLVQELHGTPWHKHHKLDVEPPLHHTSPPSSLHTPALSPSSSETSLPPSGPNTPPHVFTSLKSEDDDDIQKLIQTHLTISARPEMHRRPSHDLFECIEQSEHKRLTESQARYVFSQVVDAVEYLEEHGITHRDIKDENLVIDKNLKVKLIDFGSAIAVNPDEPRPFYKTFYGTAAYASSEQLLKKDYQAAPAEIWTIGVLLSYLLAGVSPFPHARDAVDGKIYLCEKVVGKISDDAMDLMRKCLDPNPKSRATISQVKAHPWLQHRC